MDFTGEWITRDGSRATVVTDSSGLTTGVVGTFRKFNTSWDDTGDCIERSDWDLVERYVQPEQRR